MTGNELRKYRQRESLSQKRLGQLLGYSDQQIARWESYKSQIPASASALLYILIHYKRDKTAILDLLISHAIERMHREFKKDQ